MIAVTLPEPVKLREIEANEQTELSDFQVELVQLAATLNGDHKKDIYPHKLVEGMNVADAVNYVKEGFEFFMSECEKAKQAGVDGCEIIECANSHSSSTSPPPPPRNFWHKILGCIFCDRGD